MGVTDEFSASSFRNLVSWKGAFDYEVTYLCWFKSHNWHKLVTYLLILTIRKHINVSGLCRYKWSKQTNIFDLWRRFFSEGSLKICPLLRWQVFSLVPYKDKYLFVDYSRIVKSWPISLISWIFIAMTNLLSSPMYVCQICFKIFFVRFRVPVSHASCIISSLT